MMVSKTYGLGTLLYLDTGADEREEVMDEALKRLGGIDAALSYFRPDSDISRINANAGLLPQKVGRHALTTVGTALAYGRLTRGAIDLTVRPVLNLWNIGKETGNIPGDKLIRKTRRLVDYRDILLDSAEGTLGLRRKWQALDVNCIAKGYAADEIAGIFASRQVESGMINLGGNVFAYGKKPDGSLWRIGIQHPEKPRGESLGFVEVCSMSVVTSGCYEKYFISGGKRYHHIFDPKTGYPVNNSITSVTVVSRRSIDGDALTTCIYVMGSRKGLALAEGMEGVGAIVVEESGMVHITENLRNNFTLTHSDFTLVQR